jgi:hypothetical protein
MAKRTDDENQGKAPVPFPKMLTLDEVQEILNLGNHWSMHWLKAVS